MAAPPSTNTWMLSLPPPSQVTIPVSRQDLQSSAVAASSPQAVLERSRILIEGAWRQHLGGGGCWGSVGRA